jgi:uncharacterized membrane protein YidH (DUF202 family)
MISTALAVLQFVVVVAVLALIVAGGAVAIARRPGGWWLAAGWVIVSLVTAGALAALAGGDPRMARISRRDAFLIGLALVSVPLGLAAVGAWWLGRRRSRPRVGVHVTATAVVFVLAIPLGVMAAFLVDVLTARTNP